MDDTRKAPRRGMLPDMRAAALAGLIAGLVFLVLEMVMVPLFLGDSAWAPPRMIAAIVMGEAVLPPPATFDAGIVMAALALHFPLSIIYAVVLAMIVHRFALGTALAVGILFGIALYVVNFYGFTAVFPWFAMARNWVSIFAHAVFGAVAAWTYLAIRKPAQRTA
jgi:uncharacterized membrane protein YagU involved in acid resistance